MIVEHESDEQNIGAVVSAVPCHFSSFYYVFFSSFNEVLKAREFPLFFFFIVSKERVTKKIIAM
jgi:hypothetical protein